MTGVVNGTLVWGNLSEGTPLDEGVSLDERRDGAAWYEVGGGAGGLIESNVALRSWDEEDDCRGGGGGMIDRVLCCCCVLEFDPVDDSSVPDGEGVGICAPDLISRTAFDELDDAMTVVDFTNAPCCFLDRLADSDDEVVEVSYKVEAA